MLENDRIDGSNIENLIMTMSKTDVYKPRKGKVGDNLQYFTAEQLCYIEDKCGKMMKKFGYTLGTDQDEISKQRFSTDFIQTFNQSH